MKTVLLVSVLIFCATPLAVGQFVDGPQSPALDFSHAFASIVKELSSQYSLGYYPTPLPEQGERRRIKVDVNLPNVAVRARGDYVFTTPARLPPANSNKEK